MKFRAYGALCALLGLIPSPAVRAQTAASGETVIATVNREPVTLGDWVRRMQTLHAQDFIASVNPLQLKATTAGQIALESLVNTRLLLQYARKTSLLPPDAEVDADLKKLMDQPYYKDGVARKQFTEAQLRNDILVQRTLFNVATVNERVTPEEVKAYYDRHPEQFGRPERWQLALIRVSTQAAAEKAAAELKKGTDFGAVAAQLSEDNVTKSQGGKLLNAQGQPEWFTSGDPRLPEAIRTAVKKLKLGEVTPPLQGSLGGPAGTSPKPVFFLVRLIGKEEMSVQPLEQIRPTVERLALYDKVGGPRGAEGRVAEFRKTSDITVNLPEYEGLYKK